MLLRAASRKAQKTEPRVMANFPLRVFGKRESDARFELMNATLLVDGTGLAKLIQSSLNEWGRQRAKSTSPQTTAAALDQSVQIPPPAVISPDASASETQKSWLTPSQLIIFVIIAGILAGALMTTLTKKLGPGREESSSKVLLLIHPLSCAAELVFTMWD